MQLLLQQRNEIARQVARKIAQCNNAFGCPDDAIFVTYTTFSKVLKFILESKETPKLSSNFVENYFTSLLKNKEVSTDDQRL